LPQIQRKHLLYALAMLLACGNAAWGQGFGLYEQGACMMGRAGAGVAAPCQDGSGIFFNPAALSFKQTELSVSGVLIGPRGQFTDKTTGQVSKLNAHWYVGPNFYATKPFGGRVAVGLGVFAPYGLSTDWPVNSQGRYLGYHSAIKAIYAQPTVAFKVNDRFSVGGGVDLTYMSVALRQRVDLSAQPFPAIPGATFGSPPLNVPAGTDFANVNLSGDNWHVGYHLGALLKANDKFSFGIRYLAGQKVAVDNGKIETKQIPSGLLLPFPLPGVAPAGTPLDVLLAPQFASGALLSNQSATTSIPLPAQLVAGVAFQLVPRARLMVDYQYTRWSAFDVLQINGQYLKSTIVESYRDTHGARIGTEIKLTDRMVLRAGLNAHGGAAPDQTVTPNLPEGQRTEVNVGFGAKVSRTLLFDAAYMRLVQPDRAGRTGTGGHAVPTVADNNGTYQFHGNLFSMGLSLAF
jgi:long-chain fatty acid transport protein